MIYNNGKVNSHWTREWLTTYFHCRKNIFIVVVWWCHFRHEQRHSIELFPLELPFDWISFYDDEFLFDYYFYIIHSSKIPIFKNNELQHLRPLANEETDFLVIFISFLNTCGCHVLPNAIKYYASQSRGSKSYVSLKVYQMYQIEIKVYRVKASFISIICYSRV